MLQRPAVTICAESGASGRIRTTDTRIFNPLLYQLSYRGTADAEKAAAFGSAAYKRGMAALSSPFYQPLLIVLG